MVWEGVWLVSWIVSEFGILVSLLGVDLSRSAFYCWEGEVEDVDKESEWLDSVCSYVVVDVDRPEP